MVRKYKKVLGRARRQNYSASSLERAIKEVTSGRKTLRQAEEQFGVPRNTISSHVRAQKSGTKLKNLGGQSVLSEEEEQCIYCSCHFSVCKMGLPASSCRSQDYRARFPQQKRNCDKVLQKQPTWEGMGVQLSWTSPRNY